MVHAIGLLFDVDSGLTFLNTFTSYSQSKPDASESTYDRITRETAFNVIDAVQGDLKKLPPPYAPEGSNPGLAGRVPGRSATHNCEPRLALVGQARQANTARLRLVRRGGLARCAVWRPRGGGCDGANLKPSPNLNPSPSPYPQPYP